MNDRQPEGRWKSVQYDYDALDALDDDESCLYCLTARDVMLILSSLDYFAWKTRYISYSNTAIDQEKIDAWQGKLGADLMTCLAVRQDPENPCLLQQENEDGTWTTWANLRSCPPKLRIVGGAIVIELPDDTFYTPTEDDTFDGRDTPFTPPVRTDPPDDANCLAAANAENVIFNMHADVFSKVFVPDATWAALTLVAVIIGLLALPVAIAIIVSVIIAGGGVAILSGVELADFTSVVRKQLRCIFLSHATNDAGVITFDFAAVQTDVSARIVGINIWAAINLYLSIIGEAGLNRAGATTAISEFECACDEWCYVFDFTISDGGWTNIAGQASTYVPGMGWKTGVVFVGGDPSRGRQQCFIEYTGLPSVELTAIATYFTKTLGNTSAVSGDVAAVNNFSSPFLYSTAGTNTTSPETWGGDKLGVNSIQVTLSVGGCDGCGDPGGVGYITSLQFNGRGDNPFGDDNCA